jgi:hypothetical protein
VPFCRADGELPDERVNIRYSGTHDDCVRTIVQGARNVIGSRNTAFRDDESI